MDKGVTLVNKDGAKIPNNTLCVFGKLAPRGMTYFIGFKREGEDVVRTHFSMKKHELEKIISFQPVLNTIGRTITQK